MNRMLRLWSAAIAIALITVPAVQAAQDASSAVDPQGIERLKAATGGRAEVSIRRGTGAAQFVRLGAGSGDASLAPQSARGASATQQAKAFFAQYGGIFGIQNAESDLVARDERTDRLGFKHATLQQVHRGVPVFGAELKAHVDAEGRLVAVNGTGVPGITVDTTPSRSAAEAGAVALAALKDGALAAEDGNVAPSLNEVAVRNTRLVVYRTGLLQGVAGEDHLTYEVEVGNGGDVREFVFVDAHTGKKVDQITGTQDGLSRRAYDGLNLPDVPPSYPDSPYWVEGDPLPTPITEANNMIYASKETYDMYWNAFGYDSFDSQGAIMDAIFNRGYDCPNASWNGTFISFCPGFTTDDVTAHEWSHAYTQYTDNLIYAWQSGALNEAYSDMYGETVDLINNRGLDSPGTPRVSADTCSQFGGAPPPVLIVTGGSAAGSYQSLASVSEPPRPFTVTAPLGLAVPASACSAVTGVSGKIAVIDWTLLPNGANECGSGARAQNALNAGAVGIIFVAPASGTLNLGSLTTIASVQVRNAEGTTIKAGVPSSISATITLGVGTDNTYRWLMGEEVTPGGALRDMANPRCFGDPGKVSDVFEYACSTADQGGVHTNSGVPNRMFSLLVDGGFYNNRDVTAIGLTKAAHVYFRAKFYHVESTDFPGHADAMEQACNDLRGHPLASLTGTGASQFITANDCVQVTRAIAAVELRLPPTQCNFQPQLAKTPPANVCVVGPANLLYTETAEGSIDAWTRTNAGVFPPYVPRDWVKNSSLPGGRAGSALFAKDDPNLGDCNPTTDDQSGVVYIDSPAITLPVTPGFPRLVFDHYVATEAGWDGGNIKVSVNDGPWQNTVFTQFAYNPYQFFLFTAAQGNTNPLQGQQAFTGTDGGTVLGSWGKSILDLAGMGQPGDSVRVRFAFGTDGCGGNDGWYVDDIKMYQCTAGGAATVSINDVTVTEGNSGTTTAAFTLTLSEPSSATVSVRASTANGTAVGGNDYQVTSQVVSFPPGTTTATFNVLVYGDLTAEPNETFFVNLTEPFAVTIADGQGLGTILDDGDSGTAPIPSMVINNVTLTEGNVGTKNATFTLTITPTTDVPVTVHVDTADGTATAGSDYTAVVDQLVTFPPGAATQTVSVSVIGDTTIEPNETFFVNLTNPTNATIADAQGLGTITNDDVTTVSINDVTHPEGQSGTTNATFTVSLSVPSLSTVTVRVNTANGTATAPGDYTAVSNLTLTFAPGETSKTVDVPVIDDQLIEGPETFFVNLTLPTNATIADAQGVGTITDDDTAGGFFTVAPCRVIDTRSANAPALAAQTERVFVIGGQCGIPVTAKAVVVNLTAINATQGGFLRAYAAAAPNTSVLSFNSGSTRGNNAIVGLNPAGEATIFNGMAAGTVDLAVDVTGYFE